jgi:hypothetical protein
MLAHALYLLAAIVAITVLLIAGIAADSPWCKSVFRAWDYLGAAIFGGDGRHSISAYCGRAQRDNGPGALQDLAVVIDFIFGKDHCVEAANRENP